MIWIDSKLGIEAKSVRDFGLRDAEDIEIFSLREKLRRPFLQRTKTLQFSSCEWGLLRKFYGSAVETPKSENSDPSLQLNFPSH